MVVDIPKGATARKVAAILKEKGIVRKLLFVRGRSAYLGATAKRLRSGEYMLRKDRSIRDTLATLVEGKTILYRITIPEGLTIKEIGSLLAKKGVVTKRKVYRGGARPLTSFPVAIFPPPRLKGTCFRRHTVFQKNTTEKELVKAMVATFFDTVKKAGVNPEGRTRQGFLRLVTLASLIEKETSIDSEREIVASVYTNRLKKGMLLQCDPTVIYALPSFDGNIRRKDLFYDSPYNTYLYPGLPPGPIANPGIASFKSGREPGQNSLFLLCGERR